MLNSKFHVLRFIAAAVLLLSSTFAFSQDKDFAFSAYSNFDITNQQSQSWHPQGIEIERSNYALGYFSPAVLLFKENGDFHEFEIAKFRFNKSEADVYGLDSLNNYTQLLGGATVSDINIALRYTYSFQVDLFDEESKFQFYIGAGASPYYQSTWMSPRTSDTFPVSSSSGGILLSAIPTITYSISNNWFLNLNIPISVIDTYSSTTKTENPVIPIADRKSTTFDIDLFPNDILVRFGLGLKI